MKHLRAVLLLLLLAVLAVPAQAAEADWDGTAAEAAGFPSPQRLTDGDRGTYTTAQEGAAVTLSRSGGISALYLEFDRPPQPWTLTDPASGRSVSRGEEGFLHEFADLSALLEGQPETVELRFPAGTVIAEIYAFSPGELPDWVQIWQPPLDEADLLLISSHSDDEQLFFAGLLPYYGVERGLGVQVAYLVQHFEANGVQDHKRPHEQLDGLWTVGVRNYPIISGFPDLYSEGRDRAEALANAQAAYRRAGNSYEDFVGYLTACIRRCRPLVVVSHDLDGEYGHGTHVLCADALGQAVQRAADPEQFPDSAAAYGPWQAEKLYLHLYGQGQVVLDLDTPLDSLGGKSPFQVTQEGFACHKSQHWTWFYRWIYGTKEAPITRADQIKTYSPCQYGLYATQVGPDQGQDDLFEHVETYAARRERAAQEEAERLAAEQARLEAERAAQEEQARLQAEEEARAQSARERALLLQMGGAALAALALCVLAGILISKTRRRR